MDTASRSFIGPSMVLGAALFGLFAYLLLQLLKIGSRPANFPPGPPTTPILGNIVQIAGVRPQDILTEWAKKYGPVYSIMKGATPYLVVSGPDEAHEIFNKRGQLTANRPAQPMSLLPRGGYSPVFMGGPKWRIARRMWHSILNVGAAKQYLPYQQLEVKKLLADVLDDGERWRQHIERYSNSVGMTMTNGRRITHSRDPNIMEIIQELTELNVMAVKGGWMDAYPFLSKLPDWLFPIRREAQRLAVQHQGMLRKHYNMAKEGTIVLPSFVRSIQEKLKHGFEGVSEMEGAEIGDVLLEAATDTTASSVNNWIGAMALFPETQRKAQEEIDRVIGPDRLPNQQDADNLPYVRQMTLELQRWITAVPLALQHATTAPMKWGTYDIPAGTGLILNTYAIHGDPTLYPNPREFRPERWEGKMEMGALSDESVGARSELFTFGAGRRVCPGQHLAESNLFLVVSSWLWAFDTQQARDAEGKEIPIDIDDVREGIIITLNPFRVDIKARSTEKERMVRRAWMEEKEMLLDEDEQWSRSPEGVSRLMERAGK